MDVLKRSEDVFSLASLPPFYRSLAADVTEEALQDAVDELRRLPENKIIAQFLGIPREWGAADGFAEMLKSFILGRRGALTWHSGSHVMAAMRDAGLAT